MVAHDPLTPSQQALFHELQHTSFEMTIQEQSSSPRGHDLQFLMGLGLVKIEPTYIAQDTLHNRNRFSWSGKHL